MGRRDAAVERQAPVKRVQRTDRISGVRVRADGTVRGVVRRAGVLLYKLADGTTTRELVTAETLGAPASLASLVGRPVTVGHPVSGKAGRDDAVGTITSAAVEGTLLVAVLRIDDASARAAIEAGELVELSSGYACRVDATPGTTPSGERYDAVQQDVVFDHVAMLSKNRARCGPVCSLRADDASHTCNGDSMDPTEETTEPTTETTAEEPMAACAEKLETILAAVLAIAASMKIDLTAKPADAPPAPAPKTDAMDPAALDERLAVFERARRIVPSLRTDSKSNDEIRREVLTKLDGAACVEGRSELEVRGMFDGRFAAFSNVTLAAARLGGPAQHLDAAPALSDKWRLGALG